MRAVRAIRRGDTPTGQSRSAIRREGQVCRWTSPGHAAKVLSRDEGAAPATTMVTNERCQEAPGSVVR